MTEGPMTKEPMAKKPFDIKQRTFGLGVEVVKLVGTTLPRTVAGFELAKQIVRSGTSIGANVEEADAAESKRDFIHKMSIARKEARGTRYWLCIIDAAGLVTDQSYVLPLIRESDELVRILSTIIASTQRNLEKESKG
jgi:four helix bundle protein